MTFPPNLIEPIRQQMARDGIGPSGFNHTIVATNTILRDNGLGVSDGGSHNVYASSACVSAQFGPGLTSIVSQGGGGGHAIKSRANATSIIGPAFIYSADASSLDLPDGSTKVVKIGPGVTIAKKAGDANHTVIGYAVESETNGLAGVEVAGAVIETACDSPIIQTVGPVAFDASTIFKGNKPTAAGGGAVTGLPA